MNAYFSAGLILTVSLLGVICRAEEPPPPPMPYVPGPTSPAAPVLPSPTPVPDVPFAEVLKRLVVKQLPRDIVFEQNENWGHQAHVPSLQGLKVIQVMRNHGTWQRMKAVSADVPHRSQLFVYDMRYSVDRLSYTVQMYFPATFEFEHQIWQNGIHVQSSRGRARFRLNAEAFLEARIQFNGSGQLMPEQVAPPRITNSRVLCDFFVVDSVDGMGGEVARIIAGKVDHPFQQWKPIVERDMRAKVNKALLQAEQTPAALAATARLVNAIVAEATARALHPPFSSAVDAGQPSGPVPPPGTVVQIDPSIFIGFGAFLNTHLNGASAPGREGAGASSERWHHEGGSSGGGSLSSGSSHESSSGHSSSSSHSESSSHGDSPHHR